MQKTLIKIGVRSSNLALTMAFEVKKKLEEANSLKELVIKIEAMSTRGDRILNRSLAKIGGKGLFTAEIENALLNNDVDLAVHSTKDMPTFLPDNLKLSAYIKRGVIEDCFVSHKNIPFLELPKGATIGTSSLRRQALVKRYRPDLNIVLLRGNVETRLGKVKSGDIDGTFLALCGIQRLNLTNYITEIMPLDFFPPAPAQGCICLETRSFDAEMLALVNTVNDINTQIEVMTERAFLKDLDGSCRTPICAYARCSNDKLFFYGLILLPDGSNIYEYNTTISFDKDFNTQTKIDLAQQIGSKAAQQLKMEAGEEFFSKWQ